MMIGAPGSGKTMLAKRMTGILPAIEDRELQEALCVHSVAGEPVDGLLRGTRPFRSPHHSISAAGLVGGGRPVRPGEISLAHGGVLYLDELGEFPSNTLQMLRQPLEDGSVRIVRVDGAYLFARAFPAGGGEQPVPLRVSGRSRRRLSLLGCGHRAISSQARRPLADRIDIVLHIARPDPSLIIEGAEGLSTKELADMVRRGRAFRASRERARGGPAQGSLSLESSLAPALIDSEAREVMLEIAKRTNLTGRGIARLARIARAIADLEEADRVDVAHVLEASQLQGRRDVGGGYGQV